MSAPHQARVVLEDALAVWWVARGDAAGDVVDAATAALVAGLDSPALRELAGMPRRSPRSELLPVVEAAVDELGLRATSGGAEVAAMAVMARRFLTGTLDRRSLLLWAAEHIGEEGDVSCDGFVELAELEGGDQEASEAQRDEWAREEAEAFLAGAPSPVQARWATGSNRPARSARWPALRARLRGRRLGGRSARRSS
ncbi:hypothetical protein [Cellulomonas massiliensis]|uniref:hypothetical protein n=1 Tax=Cellulomonas massiliensis TaxID=1465811 RepID=UPI0003183086|nr:hypothetical protein [Cellulomonas massiliensis]